MNQPTSSHPPSAIDHPTSAAPPSPDYRVRLDAYAGPLDLLLYLVKRHEIDLHDIPVAELTEQYLRHLEVIKSIDVESAGEFLVMACTLVEIKSRMIIPQSEREEGDEDPTQDIEETEDPRFELVQQLLAYKAFKDAAYTLEDRAEEWERRFPVRAKAGERAKQDDKPQEVTIDLEDVNVYDLCEAFGRILESVGHLGDHEVTYDDTPISMHAEDIHDRLRSDAPGGGLTLREIFEGRKTRSEMIGLFLATLELVRQRLVRVMQDEALNNAQPGENIRLVLVPDSEREAAAQADSVSDAASVSASGSAEEGAQDYDWPDEESRLRFERRERLRATLAAKAEAEARGEEFDIKAYKKQLADERGGEVDDLDDEELAIEQDDAEYLNKEDDQD